MDRVWAKGNPTCDRAGCHHPLRGDRRTGHFNLGAGPCRAQGCTCRAFLCDRAEMDNGSPVAPQAGTTPKGARHTTLTRPLRRSVQVK